MKFRFEFLLLATFLTILVNADSLKTHGEKCQNHKMCNSAANLYCNGSQICDCIIPTEMTYNGTTCVLLAGSRMCRDPSQPDYYYPNFECVESSSCVPSGMDPVCKCLPKFYPTATRFCKPKNYGAKCESETDCGADTNLICNEQKTCTCNSTISTYDNTTHQCGGLLGENCDKFGKPCDKNMKCQDGKCACSPEYFLKPSGECELKREYNSSCEDYKNSCKRPFTCDSSFRCVSCDSSAFIYEGNDGECSRLAGVKCMSDNERLYWTKLTQEEYDTRSQNCVTNAECDGRCRCKTNYRKSLEGTCLVTHNSSCSMDPNQKCLKKEGTRCIEGLCSCINGQVFDKERLKCVAQVYSQCNDTTYCVEGAHCASASSGENSKQCICNEGFVSVDNNCHPTVGQPCDFKPKSSNPEEYRKPNRICDPLALSLQCVEGICQCKHMEYYDNVTQTCKGLIGASCDLQNFDVNGYDKYCPANSKCVNRRNFVNKQGVCSCKMGWKRGIDGNCEERVEDGKK